jgi:hypothetical protein
MFIPKMALKVAMYKNGTRDEVRIFLDKDTMTRWIKYMREDGYEIHGFVESIPLLVNNKGN